MNTTSIDLISRQAAIDIVEFECGEWSGLARTIVKAIEHLPSAQPDNQVHLCDSCDYSYPDCPSKKDDVIFGNGIGNDNICACNKYKPSAQSDIVKNLVTIFQNSKDMKLIARDGDLRADLIDAGRMPFAVRTVVTGKWIKLDMHRGMEQYKCSACNSECYVPECMGEPLYEFCPNCGARMVKRSEEMEETE